MTKSPALPRVPPLPMVERSASAQQLLETVAFSPDSPVFTTLIRAEGLMRKWLPFSGKLLKGKIPTRDRELLILRTSWNCKANYEWASHVVIGRTVGLTDEEIALIATDSETGWGPWDWTILRAADELHYDWRISDDTWAALSRRYDTPQLIELPMLVGHYHMIAMTLNTLGIEPDEGLTHLPRQAR